MQANLIYLVSCGKAHDYKQTMRYVVTHSINPSALIYLMPKLPVIPIFLFIVLKCLGWRNKTLSVQAYSKVAQGTVSSAAYLSAGQLGGRGHHPGVVDAVFLRQQPKEAQVLAGSQLAVRHHHAPGQHLTDSRGQRRH